MTIGRWIHGALLLTILTSAASFLFSPTPRRNQVSKTSCQALFGRVTPEIRDSDDTNATRATKVPNSSNSRGPSRRKDDNVSDMGSATTGKSSNSNTVASSNASTRSNPQVSASSPMKQEITTSASANTNSSATLALQRRKEGIGGDGGWEFDVNKLKRNLLQETIRQYKQQILFNDDNSMSERDILQRLAALVEASPVRTTTDSNLLDGTWTLALQSHDTTASELLTTPSSTYFIDASDKYQNNGDEEAAPLPRRPRPTTLLVVLEEDGEARNKNTVTSSSAASSSPSSFSSLPYLIETQRYWKVFQRQTRRVVTGLTRRTLTLQTTQQVWKTGRRPLWTRRIPTKDIVTEVWDIVYCDGDLCIVHHSQDDSYQVWSRTPVQYNKKRRSKNVKKTTNNNNVLFTADAIFRDIVNEDSRLRFLKLGDLPDAIRKDSSWDGLEDPFVHLSADERQAMLRNMSLKEVEEARRQRLQERPASKKRNGKRGSFRKPSP